MNRFLWAGLCVPLWAAASSAGAASCESLASLTLPNVKIVMAQQMQPGPFPIPITMTDGLPAPALQAFCRIAGVASPVPGSAIKFEVWMPVSGWNKKFNGAGNGSLGTNLTTPYIGMANGLARGYAVAGTDMGHDAAMRDWALNHPERVVDWGSRATHITAATAKKIIAAYYGEGPQRSYFTGCSDGGHEALMEAQRFPEDYDGIVAGAPANYFTHQAAAFIWDAQAALANPAGNLSADKLALVTKAALAKCDALDGITDGVIDDPRTCRFDPAVLQCKAGDAADCLTAPQVEAVKKIYAGPHNLRTGARLYPGPMPSSELSAPGRFTGWAFQLTGPDANYLGVDIFKYLLFNDPTWDWHTFDVDRDVAKSDATLSPVVDAIDPDLSAFKKRGGKLIAYQGWLDPAVHPENAIDYYEKAAAKNGADTDRFFRLFMVPGMGHCFLGPGPNNFSQPTVTPGPNRDAAHNVLTALDAWVEHDAAPDRFIAAKYRGDHPTEEVLRTRPLCPYPKTAHYKGTGNTDDARNFACAK